MSFLRRHRRAIALSAFLVTILTALTLFYRLSSELAHPPRRALQDYHRDFLAHPQRHGFRIDTFTASHGTPVLICTPLPGSPLGPRGLALRSQFENGEIPLRPVGETIGTLVLVHGRKGRKEDYLPIAERLCAAGFRCILPDLPAHGEHPAKEATYGIREASIPAAVLNEASIRFGFSSEPAGLLGMSMGGSVAIHAAALPDAPWKALVIISSFDALAPAVEGQASQYLGSTLGNWCANSAAPVYQFQTGLSINSIRPARLAASLRLPTLVAHGTDDTVVLVNSGRRLFDSLPATTVKNWVEIPDAGHDNVLITSFPIYRLIAEWMLTHVPAATSGNP